MKSLRSNLLLKVVFLALKILQTHYATRKKNVFSNFKRYDLIDDEEFESKIWGTYRCTSKVVDLTVTYLKIG